MAELEQKIIAIGQKHSKESPLERGFNKLAGVQNKVDGVVIGVATGTILLLPLFAPLAVIAATAAGADLVTNKVGADILKERRESNKQRELAQLQKEAKV